MPNWIVLFCAGNFSLGKMGRNVRYFHRKFMADEGILQSERFLSNRSEICLVLGSRFLCRFVRNYLQFFPIWTILRRNSIIARIFAQEINFLQSQNFSVWNSWYCKYNKYPEFDDCRIKTQVNYERGLYHQLLVHFFTMGETHWRVNSSGF
jgi:hypothetical protein